MTIVMTCDQTAIHRDINDIQQVITADNADYHIYEYERFTNESIIAKNITASCEAPNYKSKGNCRPTRYKD